MPKPFKIATPELVAEAALVIENVRRTGTLTEWFIEDLDLLEAARALVPKDLHHLVAIIAPTNPRAKTLTEFPTPGEPMAPKKPT